MALFETDIEKNILLVSYFVTVVVLVFLLVFSFKISNDEFCGVDRFGSVDSSSLSATLVDNTSYGLQFNNVPLNSWYSAESFTYCFYGSVNTTDSVDLSVVNQDGFVLGSKFFGNFSDSVVCIPLDFLSVDDFVGVRCDDCDANNVLKTFERSLVSEVETYYFVGDSLSVGLDKPLSYYLVVQKNCRPLFKTFFYGLLTWWGIWFIVWLFWLGILFIKNKLMEGWY